MLKEKLRACRAALLLGLIAVPLGAAVGVLDAVFGRVLLWLTAFRMAHAVWLIPLLGPAGAGIVWCYQKIGGASARGMSLIFEAGHGETDDIPLRLIPLTIAGTWLTLLFGFRTPLAATCFAVEVLTAGAKRNARWLYQRCFWQHPDLPIQSVSPMP